MNKKSFKLIFSLMLVLCTVCAFAVTAYADVIWEPEDDFYLSHSGKCYHLGDEYIANGKEGYVYVYENPNSSSPEAFILNGNQLFISFAYDSKNGSMGVIEYNADENGNLLAIDYSKPYETGWVYLADLSVKYGSDEFFADHADEIENPEEFIVFEGGSEVSLHTYPGSSEYTEPMVLEGGIVFNAVYTDAAGTKWGYINYYRGIRDRWLVIETAPEPPSEGLIEMPPVSVEDITPPKAPSEEKIENTNQNSYVIIAVIAVLAVVIITLVIIFAVFGKKKRGQGK